MHRTFSTVNISQQEPGWKDNVPGCEGSRSELPNLLIYLEERVDVFIPSNHRNPDIKLARLTLFQDTGVGKSSIVWRFVEDSFDPNINPTIGML
ncbi:ras-related protein Rab-22A-like protein [Cricetulus griseus]|uniref:Ras-related protein Rab-22A-like protein n=1 Tax=Cricetulus griseus TaxID=10029 RepID=A0A061I3Y7_CRIGR|nr:ras-related protein Rab-22A-like protein [Cricetulus griseus]